MGRVPVADSGDAVMTELTVSGLVCGVRLHDDAGYSVDLVDEEARKLIRALSTGLRCVGDGGTVSCKQSPGPEAVRAPSGRESEEVTFAEHVHAVAVGLGPCDDGEARLRVAMELVLRCRGMWQ